MEARERELGFMGGGADVIGDFPTDRCAARFIR